MTEEQKRFKIMKKTSYEELVSKADGTAISNALLLGGTAAAAAICALSVVAEPNAGTVAKLVFVGLGITESTFSALSLKSLIQAISKKTMYESKIEDIINELEYPENKEPEDEESRGMER